MVAPLPPKAPGRNEPCPCGSRLKYKHCHGDDLKIETAKRIANQVFTQLVMREQVKRGICPNPECDGTLEDGKCTKCTFVVPEQSPVIATPAKNIIIPN